ncbi:phosphate ABC transporter permease subunit PstC [Radicibacter daui]|uniref:phosphate ABC transporter permease subunit PstC n=1 Tax=Radicibacter daui TaxID=3064829 RepID=UPI004046CCDE
MDATTFKRPPTEDAIIGTSLPSSAVVESSPAVTLKRGASLPDKLFIGGSRILGAALIALLFGIMAVLVFESWPSLKEFGFGFITSSEWDPVEEHFGAFPAIVGTLVSSVIALIVAVPVSFGIAVFVNEIVPPRVGVVIARLIELMAGIPSIIYGMWGLLVFAPFMAAHVQPVVIEAFDGVPILGTLFGPPPIGIGMMTAGLILSFMVLPLITAVMRDVFSAVPTVVREAAYGLGATRWEVVRLVLVPYTKVGLIGGVILGFGRALGETMAVTFVIGNAHELYASLFMPGTSISATIANEFSEATGEMYSSALMELGLILFAITVVVLVISRLLMGGMRKKG